jgi:hypothetical protein
MHEQGVIVRACDLRALGDEIYITLALGERVLYDIRSVHGLGGCKLHNSGALNHRSVVYIDVL